MVDVADFIEEYRALVRGFEYADAVAVRARVGALQGSEQFALEQAGRDGAAIDRDERLRRAAAHAVDHARDEFLAGAGFAFDENRGVDRRRERDLLVDRDHLRRHADHLGFRDVVEVDLGVLAGAGERAFGAFHDLDEIVDRIERFGEVIKSAAARGGHHRFHGSAARHEDHGRLRIPLLDLAQDVESRALVQIDIGDHDRVGALFQTLARG